MNLGSYLCNTAARLLLVDALQKTESAGNYVDKATFKTKQDGTMQVSYRVRPTQLIIETDGRRFKLRLEEVKKET